MKRIIIGITGASGSVLFKNLLEQLILHQCDIFLIATENGEKVFEYETKVNFRQYINSVNYKNLHLCDINDMFSKVASGSFVTDGMIIIPCSMGTIGKIANGTSDNLLIRACDVQLKEKRKVLIAFREAPLSYIHLRNLETLTQAGAIVFPAVPAFYNFPQSIDELISQIVGRILSYFDINSVLKKEWIGNEKPHIL